jgi:hypothetical protein
MIEAFDETISGSEEPVYGPARFDHKRRKEN